MADVSRRNLLRGTAAAVGGYAALHGMAGPAAAVAGWVAPAPGGGDRYPFLHGAFAPVTEEVTAFHLPVTGRIPRELNGRYLRTGPNVLGLEDARAHHWLLGQGMVHG